MGDARNMTPQEILRKYYGYRSFRTHQLDIIESVIRGQDAFVLMPTGSGKSICYQIPAILRPGVGLVVSPLIALMQDQVQALRQNGLRADFLNSSLTANEAGGVERRVVSGAVDLLYVAPERLLTESFQRLLQRIPIALFAIDEAHCVSQWGHDFRPEYLRIAEVTKRFGNVPKIALTATADAHTRKDIIAKLELSQAAQFVSSFDRPNIRYRVQLKNNGKKQLHAFMRDEHPGESGIVYVRTRKRADAVAAWLATQGVDAVSYHAGLEPHVRLERQRRFLRDPSVVIVATIAFGMGINKSNVRFVVHHDLPKNPESYYQEIGRAGRDGLPAHCLLLFGYQDVQKVKYFIGQKDEHEQRVANILLNTIIGFAETDLCRRVALLNYFGETYSAPNCGMCDNCRQADKELADITIPAQMFLSCVKRTGELFGAGHIIEVLRESRSQKVLTFGHEKLSTYGIGKRYSARQWRHLSRQFIQKGLIVQELEHGSLKLTAKAWEVLRGKEPVRGRLEEEKVSLKTRADSGGRFDADLFAILRKNRKEIADRANLPPFTIFHDRTLKEMAFRLPKTREDLSQVYGVGTAKLEKYGDIFLELIRQYCRIRQSV